MEIAYLDCLVILPTRKTSRAEMSFGFISSRMSFILFVFSFFALSISSLITVSRFEKQLKGFGYCSAIFVDASNLAASYESSLPRQIVAYRKRRRF